MNTAYQCRGLIEFIVIFSLCIVVLWAIFDIEFKSDSGWMKTVKLILGLVLLGVGSGILGGMLGMGGGILKVSGLLLIFGYGIYLVRAIALVTDAVVYGSASYRYRKAGFIIPELTKLLIPSAILGVILGIIFGNYVGQAFLEKLLGLHALYVGTDMLWRILTNKAEKIRWDILQNVNEKTIVTIGTLTGFSSGALGIGGGVLSTPLQQIFLKIPLKNAIANTCHAAIFSCIFGGIIAIIHGVNNNLFTLWTHLLISISIIPGAIIGGQIGSLLTKQFPVNIVRIIFTLLMYFSFYRIWL